MPLKPIRNYGDYLVSPCGKVFSTISNKFLKPRPSRGYLQVILYKNKVPKVFSIHRLVLFVYVGPSDKDVNHKNGIKTDNRLENLEYVTKKENMAHANKFNLVNYCRGLQHGMVKLKHKDVKFIKNNTTMTQQTLANKYKVSQALISKIKRGILWKHI